MLSRCMIAFSMISSATKSLAADRNVPRPAAQDGAQAAAHARGSQVQARGRRRRREEGGFVIFVGRRQLRSGKDSKYFRTWMKSQDN